MSRQNVVSTQARIARTLSDQRLLTEAANAVGFGASPKWLRALLDEINRRGLSDVPFGTQLEDSNA